MNSQKATLCACKNKHRIPENRLTDVADSLKSNGFEVCVVDDLCKLASEGSNELQRIAETVVFACHPRAVASMFEWRGLNVKQLENLRTKSSREALKAWIPEHASEIFSDEFVEAAVSAMPSTGTEKPSTVTENEGWFPVIDKQRCVDCGRCHDFCLFGVYSKVDGKVVVAQPEKCKNNCPACARMCPERAIIFPKYDKSPINGGMDEEETFSAETMEAMYNERLRYRLQERRKSVSLLKKS